MPDNERPVNPVRTTSGLNFLVGLWLIVAPFALGFAGLGTPMWNSVIVGIAVAVFAILRVANKSNACDSLNTVQPSPAQPVAAGF